MFYQVTTTVPIYFISKNNQTNISNILSLKTKDFIFLLFHLSFHEFCWNKRAFTFFKFLKNSNAD